MRKLIFLSAILVCNYSLSAYAEVCAQAFSTLQRKIDSPKKICIDQSAVLRLKSRLEKASTEKQKDTLTRALKKAESKQVAACTRQVAAENQYAKVKKFCDRFTGMTSEICPKGISVKLKMVDVSLACKRGKFPVDFDGANSKTTGCYDYVETYFSSSKDFEAAKSRPRGTLLSANKIEENYSIVITGKLLKNVALVDCK